MMNLRPAFNWNRPSVFLVIGMTTVVMASGLFELYSQYFDAEVARAIPATQASATGSPARSISTGTESARSGRPGYKPRGQVDTSGYDTLMRFMTPWNPRVSLGELAKLRTKPGLGAMIKLDERLSQAGSSISPTEMANLLMSKAALFGSEGLPDRAYENLAKARSLAEADPALRGELLYSLVYLQGVAAMRRGENENCIDCRGESSCILPLVKSAVHTKPAGSRLAIGHFTEYLKAFPDDLEVRWLLNLAHMTLGEHPAKVDPRYLISLDRYQNSEFNIGRFRDIGHLTGLNRFNQGGGAIMEDFDNDGRLDLAVSSFDATEPLSIYHNNGHGHFDDRSESAGVKNQLGGLYCVQTDYNNDGYIDIYIPRGAWVPFPIRPSLLRNNGDFTFTDVTESAGLLDSVNSNSACWADYDNDGWLDLFVCCERQVNCLYHNKQDGTFEEVSAQAGLLSLKLLGCKGANWIDFDNDDYPDLFLNNLTGAAQLFQNTRDGKFKNVTHPMGIDGPRMGFSCWAWDYDNDGWLDIFATCYDRSFKDVIHGLTGQPHSSQSNRLFRNRNGTGFSDMTKQAGLDMVFLTMGSNFADFDGDGFLDMYLATGDPSFASLTPNRMFKNVDGRRFAEITGTSGTGHLQKGHGIACGDWDRDGDIDLFVQAGGAVNGDKFHNLHFQNPGQGNHWITVKLVGKKSNRAAIGARIKVVTAAEVPLTIHRHVSSGSSFGANPLQQTIGVAKAKQIALLEVHWPTSGTTQTFRDIAADKTIEITEFAESYRTLESSPIPEPTE